MTAEMTESKYRGNQCISLDDIFWFNGSNPVPASWIAAVLSEMKKYMSSIGCQNALITAATIQYQVEILDFDKFSSVIARVVAVLMLKWEL